MFERRLKFFLISLLTTMSLLLVRAVHLQVFTHARWVKDAEDFKRKAQLIETTRGRILDCQGREMAVDQACMDACVDYRAISRDEKWITDLAIARAKDANADAWKSSDKKRRAMWIEDEVVNVNHDIDHMFDLLAKESGQTRAQIDEICHEIVLRVALHGRWLQYRRFLAATKNRQADAKAPWYRRWILEGGKDGPQVDDYDETEGEEVSVHQILNNISSQAYLDLAREQSHCPGLVLQPGTHRVYPYHNAACHALGNLSPVMKEDLDADKYADDPLREYQLNDTIGRSGLEALCEPALRGSRGKSYHQIGQEDEIADAPVPGQDVHCTLDVELEAQIQSMFQNMQVPGDLGTSDPRPRITVPMHGAAVVIDVKTGYVRALASYPDYDVNNFARDYNALLSQGEGLDAPLLDRATQAQLEPGSTIKPAVGISAITQGVVVPGKGPLTIRTGIECTGYLILNGHRMTNGRCWVASEYSGIIPSVAHHPIPYPHHGVYGNPDGFLVFADALERSCNVYFETVADAFGAQGLSDWLRRWGFGRRTGVGIAEARGFLPDENEHLTRSIIYYSGIGQVGVRVTPIQMANEAATIARNGIWMRPRLVENGTATTPITDINGKPIADTVDLKFSKEAVAAAQDGMFRVVNGQSGTGRVGQMTDIVVAGKTGTASASRATTFKRDEKGNLLRDKDGKPIRTLLVPATYEHPTSTPWYRAWGRDDTSYNHSWFIGYAPADHPQIAFAVMVQYGGGGGGLAAETAKKILRSCVARGYLHP